MGWSAALAPQQLEYESGTKEISLMGGRAISLRTVSWWRVKERRLLWNPPPGIQTSVASWAARPVFGWHNGAPRQGSTSPRLSARPCPLRTVSPLQQWRRAGPPGTRCGAAFSSCERRTTDKVRQDVEETSHGTTHDRHRSWENGLSFVGLTRLALAETVKFLGSHHRSTLGAGAGSVVGRHLRWNALERCRGHWLRQRFEFRA